MLGSDGIAAVVDPQRDIELYIDEAKNQGLRIEYIIETHLHADFVSGHQELAARTGAKIYLGAQAGATFPHIDVHDGDAVRFGRVALRFLETPGHTVESISIVITDLDRGEKPWAVLTGDTLFIGDVGRPDLSKDHTPRELAGMLFDSLHSKILPLGDDVEVYPAHGAGSLCGKQMRPERQSTIGKERALNYALRPNSKDEFVNLLTAELPERPGYFAQDAELNRTGAAPLTELPPLRALSPAQVLSAQHGGTIVLDTRPSNEYASGHVPGAVHIALSGQYASWAAIVLGLDHEITLVTEDDEHVEESRMRLARVGIERVTGYLKGGMTEWVRDRREVAQTGQISVVELNSMLDSVTVVDVRRSPEWQDGHIESAHLKPLNLLARSLDDLDRTKPVAVHCKGGYRSAIACSLLERAGFSEVMNVTGGFDAWRACGLPETKQMPAQAASSAAPGPGAPSGGAA
jgi:glyoxylase-like metal-dependent hydrolase (beta-lactamase superfamily II)/rhodanese-related sulfurtransferase